jgi:hypothetical protein
MEKIVSQDKLRNAGRKTTKEMALLASHGIKNGDNLFKKGKKNKVCGNKGCNNRVTRFTFCKPCYSAHKKKSDTDEDSAALSSVPDNVRAQTREKKPSNLKKKMAQMSNIKKSGCRSVLLAEASALLADVLGSPEKKGKTVKINEEEAGVAETILTATPSAPATKSKKKSNSRNNRLGKLRYGFKAKSGVMKKHKKQAKAGKSAENKDNAHALLAGCVVQPLPAILHRRYSASEYLPNCSMPCHLYAPASHVYVLVTKLHRNCTTKWSMLHELDSA